MTPVLLLVYNRLDTLEQVWAALQAHKPKTLFISGDGPKPTPKDLERVQAVRTFCEKNVSWRCDVYYNWLPTNYGCGRGVSQGLSWFFSHVSEGIILEDDTWPHPDFFRFSQEMLAHFREDNRIGLISGLHLTPYRLPFAYDVIRLPLIWGWASWRRVWLNYQFSFSDWPTLRQTDFLDRLAAGAPPLKTMLARIFDRMAGPNPIDTWDYQLTYLLLKRGWWTVIPPVNLVRNLGLGHPLALHTKSNTLYTSLPGVEALPNLPSPPFLQPNIAIERYFIEHYWAPSWRVHLKRLTQTLWKKLTFAS